MAVTRYAETASRRLRVGTYWWRSRATRHNNSPVACVGAALVVPAVHKTCDGAGYRSLHRTPLDNNALAVRVDASRFGNCESVARFERPVVTSDTKRVLDVVAACIALAGGV